MVLSYLLSAKKSSFIYSRATPLQTYGPMLLAIFLFCFTSGVQARDVEPRYLYGAWVGPGFSGLKLFNSPEEAFDWVKSSPQWEGKRSFLDVFPDPDQYARTYNGKAISYYAHYLNASDGSIRVWPAPGEGGGMPLQLECPDGITPTYHNSGPAVRVSCQIPELEEPDCNKCGESVGKPIYPSTGIERHVETDYQGEGGNTLQFSRTYRSDRGGWMHNYQIFGVDFTVPNQDHGLCYRGISATTGEPYCYKYFNKDMPNDFAVQRGNGRMLNFGTATTLAPTPDINDRVTKTATGWDVHNAENETIEHFNFSGQLQSITNRNGQIQTFTYSDANTPPEVAPRRGLLIKVADAFGHALHFTYDNMGRMSTMKDPMGGIYRYAYDEASSIVLPGKKAANNLTSVTYPGGTKRIYWYNEQNNTANTDLPFAMTGITDENGARYATIQYRSDGKASSTTLAGNAQHYKVDHSYWSSAVTDPLGSQRTYSFTRIHGVVKTRSKTQPGGIGVPKESRTYDTNGNLETYSDYGGVQTIYTYDMSRNLETKRVEANDKAEAKTISTSWHSTYRLPTKIIEPLRVTNFKYDEKGNLLEKIVQATNDVNGAQGANAEVIDPIRTWSYTYNTAGQMLTSTEPGGAKTIYSYDTKGNLGTVENALKQVTKYSNYDANGRVGRIEDPNGLVQELTYTPRGWLETRTVKGRQWRYAYDGVGQLKQVDFPDGTFVSYTYDDAHRLVKVSDSLGNSITYTLDAMGNRKAEEVKDPSNTLVRKVSRTYDTLNQLEQQTGGAL